MQTISELKELAVTETPLILFDCELADGRTEHWSTHRATVEGVEYAARAIEHTAFELQTASDQGVDGSPRITVVLANADSRFSEIERECGFKGAKLTVSFVFWDARAGQAASERAVVFEGIANAPEEIREATLRLTAVNRMSLQRVLLPQVRIQRRCPWEFPATAEQRLEGFDGGANGAFSRYYRCGYAPDVEGGAGNLNGGAPYTACGYTREDCQARGMLVRFGGLEYVPPAIAVRGYGKDWTSAGVAASEARYNDFVPMVYGTAWYTAPVVFARNDGNLTRMEALLGIGEMTGVLTVLVNDYEIPLGQPGANMTGTGWYNVPTLGGRDGAFDLNFTSANGQPAGDPYGSMAYLSVVVPSRIASGNSLPTVKVLAQGLKLQTWDGAGTYIGSQLSSNPAWVLLDVLRRAGWKLDEIDLASFGAAAAYCDAEIAAVDLNGNAITVPRFACNLVLNRRRSAGDVVRGIRNAARLFLTYGTGGRLQLEVEKAGTPVYAFGDGSDGRSGILRRANGEPSVRLTSRSIADTPNRYSVEFQDSLNGYQQDSYSLVDADDVARAGQEVAATAPALGIANYDQAARMLKFFLDKSVRGNVYLEFETSVKAFGIRPGDLIAVTYLKEGFTEQAFRVLKIAPGTNFRTARITAQIHYDGWYEDGNGQTAPSGSARQGTAGMGIPRPLVGSAMDERGEVQLGITEGATSAADGTAETYVSVSFLTPPEGGGPGGPGIPLVSLLATVAPGGTLASGETLYYAVSARDSAGRESGLSFAVRAVVANDGSAVTLKGLSFSKDTTAFHVYRGRTTVQWFRIATDQPVAEQFTDTGLAEELVAPPDANFDHANFYWRRELLPEMAATAHGGVLVGNDSLAMEVNAYRGMVARITRGPGAGQERTVTANDGTTLTVAPPWSVLPAAESWFAVAEAGWHFGALAQGSPVEFAVPNRAGETVEILGRAANTNDVECAAETSPMTRWQIGGSGVSDAEVPPMPYFGLMAAPSGGAVELSGVSFEDLTNTRTISSATLTLHYHDELRGAPTTALAGDLTAAATTLTLDTAGTAGTGTILQIDREILWVESADASGTVYTVTRGIHGSTAAGHQAGAPVYHLLARTTIAAFPRDFFGSPYSGSWSDATPLEDARVGSAELFVTNQKGNSPIRAIALTNNDDNGLRTLSGGQYTIQVDGYLAVDQAVAPALVVEASHAVRDVFAVMAKAADAAVGLRLDVDGEPYCTLTFDAGRFISSTANGNALGPLKEGTKVTLAVTSVGQTYPGADLTVVIRLR